MDRGEFTERLLESYEAYFNVTRASVPTELPIVAEAEFHAHGEKYLLVKSAKLWAAETNEYVFFVSTAHLTAPLWERCREAIEREGFARVKPHSEHMYSYVSAMVVADEIDADARRAIRTARRHKSYRLSLHGWADFRAAALECSTGIMESNRMGKPMLANFESLLKQSKSGRKRKGKSI